MLVKRNCIIITTFSFLVFVLFSQTIASPSMHKESQNYNEGVDDNNWISQDIGTIDSDDDEFNNERDAPLPQLAIDITEQEKEDEDKNVEEKLTTNVIAERCFSPCISNSNCLSMVCSRCLKPFGNVGICVKMV